MRVRDFMNPDQSSRFLVPAQCKLEHSCSVFLKIVFTPAVLSAINCRFIPLSAFLGAIKSVYKTNDPLHGTFALGTILLSLNLVQQWLYAATSNCRCSACTFVTTCRVSSVAVDVPSAQPMNVAYLARLRGTNGLAVVGVHSSLQSCSGECDTHEAFHSLRAAV